MSSGSTGMSAILACREMLPEAETGTEFRAAEAGSPSCSRATAEPTAHELITREEGRADGDLTANLLRPSLEPFHTAEYFCRAVEKRARRNLPTVKEGTM